MLYRNGVAVRTLRAHGTRLAPSAAQRMDWDPRGIDGPVHQQSAFTDVFRADA